MRQLLKSTRQSIIALFCLILLSPRAFAAEWSTDLASAQAAAKAGNKLVLINFTGSDWCGWCIRLKSEVLSRPEFDAYAAQNLLLVEADFPRQKPQSAVLKKANADLAKRFNIQGFPTLVLLSGDGKDLGNLSYQRGGPQPFLAELDRLSGRKSAPSSSPPGNTAKSSDNSPPPPLFNGAPAVPPPQFNDVVLKGLSGSRNNRFAMINNRTLGPGESAVMKLGDREAKIKCLEIREDSVLVSVDGGEPRELRMHAVQMKIE